MKSRAVAAIVGSETLMGREIRDLLAEQAASPEVRAIMEEEGNAIFSEIDDEPAIITPLEAENLQGVSVAFLAGSPSASIRAMDLAGKMASPPALIDLTYALEGRPKAMLRAPQVEPEKPAPAGTIHVVAHPAAIALALFFERLNRKRPVARSVVQVFEPASERGRRGIEELQQQTVSLLSFKNVPKRVFDAQLGFNMLLRYGTEAPQKLEEIEERIDRHLATLLSRSGGAFRPSLRLTQAPVFHGYSCSVWAEFGTPVHAEEIGEALASAQIEIRTSEQEPPTNAGTAGMGGVTVGGIERDRANPRACWFWLVTDNLRLAAENAVAAARPVLEAAVR